MNKQDFIDRFTKYAQIDTQSDPSSKSSPSTNKQFNLSTLLSSQLKELNIEHQVAQNAIVYGKLAANTNKTIPKIAYLAHLDTAPDYSGTDVKPVVIPEYNGEDILLKENDIMSVATFPSLKKHIGKTIIHTDGTTLLGADDKSGITIIMEMLKYYITHPEIEHGQINFAFTIDEEIGAGAHEIDIDMLDSDFAYTVDGGELGEYSYETFNAASVEISFTGKNVHPGTAKDTMINSLSVANYFQNLLPQNEVPEHTEKREGFYHLSSINGDVSNTRLSYIIRDHDFINFENRKIALTKAYDYTLEVYNTTGSLEITDTYFNMGDKIKNPLINKLVLDSLADLNIKSKVSAVRGGTDGSILTFRGLPTPNLFTGGYNFHGKYEYLVVDDMMSACRLLIKINENNLKEN